MAVSLLFSIWSIFDLFIWASNRPDMVIFFWSMQILFEPLVYLLCFYLVYLFVKNKDLHWKWKLLGILLYFPVIILLPTKYNLIGVDVSVCNAVEGFVAQYFTYIVESIFILSIIILVAFEYKKNPVPARKKEIMVFGLGVVLFLVAFSSGNIIGSFSDNWNLAQIGLIGMPIFIGFLAYLIVRFHTFNIKLFATQVLVWGLAILIGSQFFFIKVSLNKVLNGITFVASIVFGYFLIRSVKKEIEQREELARLNLDLERLIKQRESLMHLINHKVKSSFTHSKYIFAGILDGTFGEVSAEVKKRAEQGLEANDGGIKTVDLILNAANLQKGIVKYEMKVFDFRELIAQIIGEKKIEAEKKKLALESRLGDGKNGTYNVVGDAFWLKEAVSNLIENSIKYTKPARNTSPSDAGGEGKITVSLEQTAEKKILLSVQDTGIGITAEDKKHLFTEGGRGQESVKINVDSTGYGLYSVKLVVQAHEGHVWAESDGSGKGSTFYLQLNPAS